MSGVTITPPEGQAWTIAPPGLAERQREREREKRIEALGEHFGTKFEGYLHAERVIQRLVFADVNWSKDIKETIITKLSYEGAYNGFLSDQADDTREWFQTKIETLVSMGVTAEGLAKTEL